MEFFKKNSELESEKTSQTKQQRQRYKTYKKP